MIGNKNGEHWVTPSRAYSDSSGTPDSSDSRNPASATTTRTSEGTSPARIRAGEITAFRCWKLITSGPDQGMLQSMGIPYIWRPFKGYYSAGHISWPAWTTLADCIGWGNFINDGGYYSFKSMDRCVDEFNPGGDDEPLVYGTIDMWGKVYEYEYGYRAQYVAIKSFIAVKGFHKFWDAPNYWRWCSKRARVRLEKRYIPASFNGRMTGSEPVDRGPIP